MKSQLEEDSSSDYPDTITEELRAITLETEASDDLETSSLLAAPLIEEFRTSSPLPELIIEFEPRKYKHDESPEFYERLFDMLKRNSALWDVDPWNSFLDEISTIRNKRRESFGFTSDSDVYSIQASVQKEVRNDTTSEDNNNDTDMNGSVSPRDETSPKSDSHSKQPAIISQREAIKSPIDGSDVKGLSSLAPRTVHEYYIEERAQKSEDHSNSSLAYDRDTQELSYEEARLINEQRAENRDAEQLSQKQAEKSSDYYRNNKDDDLTIIPAKATHGTEKAMEEVQTGSENQSDTIYDCDTLDLFDEETKTMHEHRENSAHLTQNQIEVSSEQSRDNDHGDLSDTSAASTVLLDSLIHRQKRLQMIERSSAYDRDSEELSKEDIRAIASKGKGDTDQLIETVIPSPETQALNEDDTDENEISFRVITFHAEVHRDASVTSERSNGHLRSSQTSEDLGAVKQSDTHQKGIRDERCQVYEPELEEKNSSQQETGLDTGKHSDQVLLEEDKDPDHPTPEICRSHARITSAESLQNASHRISEDSKRRSPHFDAYIERYERKRVRRQPLTPITRHSSGFEIENEFEPADLMKIGEPEHDIGTEEHENVMDLVNRAMDTNLNIIHEHRDSPILPSVRRAAKRKSTTYTIDKDKRLKTADKYTQITQEREPHHTRGDDITRHSNQHNYRELGVQTENVTTHPRRFTVPNNFNLSIVGDRNFYLICGNVHCPMPRFILNHLEAQ